MRADDTAARNDDRASRIPTRAGIGLGSGVGLVVANMVGVGMLTTTGFMARDLRPSLILLAWVVGGVVAVAGARAYAELASLVPRSGGEYRYLSELLHPSVGYLAGWTSLLVGFSAPIALAAYTAGAFSATLAPAAPPRLVGAVVIALVTALHALHLGWSRRAQDVLVLVKVTLLLGFALAGAILGAHRWPTWSPPTASGASVLAPFMVSLVYIAYAFSGCNAAAYVAEEFRAPRRDVPRAMVLGAALVGVGYLAVNWVLVANLGGDRLVAWTRGDTDTITLGHLLARDLVGPRGGAIMSAIVIVALLSSVSAMTLAGPRVYAEMARDRYLPRWFAGRADRPPLGASLLQGAIAIALVLTHGFELLLRNLGATLTLTTALTALCLFRARWGRSSVEKPRAIALVAAGVYVAASAWMLWFAVSGSPVTLAWIGAVVVSAGIAYGVTRQVRNS